MASRRNSKGRGTRTRGLAVEDLESRNLLSVTNFDINLGPIGSVGTFPLAVLGDNLLVADNEEFVEGEFTLDLWSYSLNDDPILIQSSVQGNIRSAANAVYFASAGSDLESGDLWRTDGTLAGTTVIESRLLGDRTASSNRTARWHATDLGVMGSGDDHVWFSNGTSLEIFPGEPIQEIWDLNEHVFFARGNSPTEPKELWITDGTLDGTNSIRDLNSGVLEIVAHEGQYFFSQWEAGSWTAGSVYDATTGTLREIDADVVQFASDGSNLYFIDELTSSLNTLNTEDLSTTEVANLTVSQLLGAENQLFFIGDEESSTDPAGLWSIGSGEAAPTKLPLSGDWLLNKAVANGERIFGAGVLDDDSILHECRELPSASQPNNRATWTSDGTVDGTHIVDVHVGADVYRDSTGCARGIAPVESGWTYHAPDFETGLQIRHTDGTSGESTVLTEVDETATDAPSRPSNFTQVDDGVLFLASDGQTSQRVFRFDATTQDVSQVSSLKDGVDRIDYIDGELYAVRDEILWQSVNDEWVPLTENVIEHFSYAPAFSDGKIAYVNTTNGILEVIGTDGITREIEGEEPGAVSWLQETNGLFMFQWRMEGGFVLYSTDGTPEGTVEVDRYNSTPSQHPFTYPTESQLFYRRINNELWRTDGTVSGTYLVESSVNSGPLVFEDSLLFGYNTPGDTNIWITDGTPNAAQLLGDWPNARVHTVGDQAYFYDSELCRTGTCDVWETDGTPGSTRFAFQIESNSAPRDFIAHRGDIYFSTHDSEGVGDTLWKFDVESRNVSVANDTATPSPSFIWEVTSTDYGIFYAQADAERGFEPTLFQNISTPWHNADTPTDVNGTDGVTPLDALHVINELSLRQYSDELDGSIIDEQPPNRLDVNNDNGVTPFDALLIVNALNRLNESAQSEITTAQSVSAAESRAASDSVAIFDTVIAFEYDDESKEEEEESLQILQF